MSPPVPFIDPETGSLDTEQIWREAFPLAGLAMLFGGLALVPFVLALLFSHIPGLGVFFTIVTQFVLAIGASIVLMYVITRGIQLADEST